MPVVINNWSGFCPTIRDTGFGLSRKCDYVPLCPGGATKTYEEIKAECLASGSLWTDPDFAAVTSSIHFRDQSSACQNIQWKRPSEICSNPQLYVDGANRMDVNQGILNDCWFLAAVSSLTTNQILLNKVIPTGQSFDKEYAGVFRFHFWQYGRWVEVLIDDRLPTQENKLIYMHSKEGNEFWSALLEKAYAKLNGSYEALSWGVASDALTDFTGGLIERFELKGNAPCDLFEVMSRAWNKGSLMGCSIDASGKPEKQLCNGLITGHAYSITDVQTIQIQCEKKIRMIRIRNPWGDGHEWKGAWSDGSKEWQKVSAEEKRKIGLTCDHDGEFWMSFKDFVSNFERLEICYLGPESISECGTHKGACRWGGCLFASSWHRRVNAGGSRNYKSTFWTNPQYHVKITEADSDDENGNGSIIIGLMQKQRRQMRKEGKGYLNIGYAVYKASESVNGVLDKSFFDRPVVARPKEFTDLREVTCRHKLPIGDYVVVPSTFEPNEEGDFILRVFSERKTDEARELDQETTAGDIKCDALGEIHPKDKDSETIGHEAFLKLAGEDGEVDVCELRDILNSTFKKDIGGQLTITLQEYKVCVQTERYQCPPVDHGQPGRITGFGKSQKGEVIDFAFDGFSKEAARVMVTMRDVDKTGKLGFEEFKGLWADLALCKRTFKLMDADGNGHFNSHEFRNALNTLGLRLNNATFKTLVIRHSHKDGHVGFDDFVSCFLELKDVFGISHTSDPAGNGHFVCVYPLEDKVVKDAPEVVKKAEVTGCCGCQPRYNACGGGYYSAVNIGTFNNFGNVYFH